MKIKFYGATNGVTGSCHILSSGEKYILLDCGMYQGNDNKNGKNESFPFDPKSIQYVILSHAHIDHCGRIPFLYKNGFRGKIFCTEGTKDLCSIILRDCASIEESRAKENAGEVPLYTIKDVENAMSLFQGFSYDERIDLCNGLSIIFKDGGHLLGSAITEIYEEGFPKLVYSGDIGNLNTPIIRDPCDVDKGQYVIMESTYGGTDHENQSDYGYFIDIVKKTILQGGNVVIPSFSIGRTQEIIYLLNKYVESGKIASKVFVDSPLAIEATKIFEKYKNYYDREAKKLLINGDNPLEFSNLVFTKVSEESKMINEESGVIIIASSGMCEGGRIKHHLINNIDNPKSSIIFTGYQAEGTLGRLILNGADRVCISGIEKDVRCSVYKIPGLSGHADRRGLIKWINAFGVKPQKIYLVHGDDDEKEKLMQEINNKGIICIIPKENEEVIL